MPLFLGDGRPCRLVALSKSIHYRPKRLELPVDPVAEVVDEAVKCIPPSWPRARRPVLLVPDLHWLRTGLLSRGLPRAFMVGEFQAYRFDGAKNVTREFRRFCWFEDDVDCDLSPGNVELLQRHW